MLDAKLCVEKFYSKKKDKDYYALCLLVKEEKIVIAWITEATYLKLSSK